MNTPRIVFVIEGDQEMTWGELIKVQCQTVNVNKEGMETYEIILNRPLSEEEVADVKRQCDSTVRCIYYPAGEDSRIVLWDEDWTDTYEGDWQ